MVYIIEYILYKMYLAFFYVLQYFSTPKCNIGQTEIEKKRTVLKTSDTTEVKEPFFKYVFGISEKRGGVCNQESAMQKWQTCGFFVWPF